MSYNFVLSKAKKALEASVLTVHEGCVKECVWKLQARSYIKLLREVKVMITNDPENFNSPPAHLIILLGGILGNLSTSKYLHSNPKLELLSTEILKNLRVMCNVQSNRHLLLLKPSNCSQPNRNSLAVQILRICVAYLGRSSNKDTDDILTACPLFRDTLIWLTIELDYPELAGDEFVPTLQPLGLRLTEDYRPCIQSAGLRIIQELIKKARIADWRYSNRAEAVLFQLLEHRVACTPGSPDALLDQVHSTALSLLPLLSSDSIGEWHDKMTNRILDDLIMECRKNRQHILLKHLLQLINTLKSSFALYGRQFLRVASITLLGPKTPTGIPNSHFGQHLDSQVDLLMLNCIRRFISFAWPVVSPNFLPELVPILVAFFDLMNINTSDVKSKEFIEIESNLSDIFSSLIKLEPSLSVMVLNPLCDSVTGLKTIVTSLKVP